MPATVVHSLSATTPDNPSYEIRPSHWNESHVVTLNAVGSEIIGAFSNSNGVSFGTEPGGGVTASYTQSTHAHTAYVFSNSNGVSFGTNGSTVTATVKTDYLTTAAQSNHSHGNPTLALTNLSGTTASNSAGLTLSLSAAAPGGGGLTNIKLSAGTLSAHRSDVTFANSNGVSFGLETNGVITGTVKTDYLTTAMASNRGSDFVQANAAFAGTSASGTIASNGISVSIGPYITTGALSNHSHGNPQLNLTNLSGTTASNSAGFTLSLSAAAPGAAAGVNRSFFEIMDGERMTTCALMNNATFSNRIIFNPFWMDGNSLQMNTIRLLASRTGGTSLSGMLGVAFYSMVNSTQLSLFHSATQTISLTTSGQFSGVRIYDVTGLSASSLSEGRWVMAILATAPGTASWGLNLMGGDGVAVAGFVNAGANQTAATNSASHIVPFWGVYSATSNGFPATVGKNQISGGQMNANSPDVYAAILEI